MNVRQFTFGEEGTYPLKDAMPDDKVLVRVPVGFSFELSTDNKMVSIWRRWWPRWLPIIFLG